MLLRFHNPLRPASWRAVTHLVAASVLLVACASDRPRHDAEGELRRAEAAYHRQDFGTAARLLAPLAMRGDADAQYALGYLHYYGRGVPRDRARAVRWFQEASQRGHAKARQALGLLTDNMQLAQVPPSMEQVIADEIQARAATPPPPAPAKSTPTPSGTLPSEAPSTPSPRPMRTALVNAARVEPPAAQVPATTKLAVASAPAKSRPKSRYTLQLLGSRSKKDLVALVKQQGLDPAKTYYLGGEHKGGPWYRLLYGAYPSQAAARAALGALPASVKNSSPWVRPIPAVAAKTLQH